MKYPDLVMILIIGVLAVAVSRSASGAQLLERSGVVMESVQVEVDGQVALTVAVHKRPPAPRREVRGVRPSQRHVWVAGHWRWAGRRYVWVNGRWSVPEHGRSVWITGRWNKHRRGGWVYVSGYWR